MTIMTALYQIVEVNSNYDHDFITDSVVYSSLDRAIISLRSKAEIRNLNIVKNKDSMMEKWSNESSSVVLKLKNLVLF